MAVFIWLLTVDIKKRFEQHAEQQLSQQAELLVNYISSYHASLVDNTARLTSVFRSSFPGSFSRDASHTITIAGRQTPILRSGSTTLNANSAIVDRFTQVTTAASTIFVRSGDDFIRIATSLKTEDGNRALGTVMETTHPAYPGLLKGSKYVGKATLFGRDYMTEYLPIQDADGTVIAVLFIGLDFTESLKALKEKIRTTKIAPSGYFFAIEAQEGKETGIFRIHPTLEGRQAAEFRDLYNGQDFIREILRKKTGIIRYHWMNGAAGEQSPVKKIAAIRHIQEWNWIICATASLDAYEVEARSVGNSIIRALLLAVAILVMAYLFVIRLWVTRPLAVFTRQIREVAGQDSDCRVRMDNKRGDELGLLADSFNSLLDKLLYRERQLEKNNDEIRLINESLEVQVAERTKGLLEAKLFSEQIIISAQDGVVVYDRDLRYRVWNPAMESLTGLSAAAVLGCHPLKFFPFMQESGMIERLEKMLIDGIPVATDVPFSLPNTGISGWSSNISAPLRDAQGDIIGIIATVRDITEKRLSRLELIEKQNNLEEINIELKAQFEESQALQEELAETLERLQNSEESHTAIIQSALDGYYLVDAQGRLLEVNESYSRMSGYSEQELLSMSVADLEYIESTVDVAARIKKIITTGKDFFQTQHRRKDGSTFHLDTNIKYLHDDDGRFVVFMRDITERKLSEDALQNSLSYNRGLIEANLDALVTIDSDGKISDVNSATEQVTGCQRRELIGTDFSDYFTEPERAQSGYQLVFKEGVVRDYPLDIRHRNGHITSVLYNASVYRDKTGNILGIFASAHDVTNRVQAEKELRRSKANAEAANEKLLLTAKAGGVAFWEYDVVNNKLFWDAQMYAIYGVQPDTFENVYEAWTAVLHPDDVLLVNEDVRKALSGEKEYELDFRVVWPGGAIHTIAAVGKVQRDAAGHPLSMVGVNWDITRAKLAEEEIRFFSRQLEEKNSALNTALIATEQATIAKSQFLSALSG
jgi:PAS domain S-box-containing protein